jgi:hypothetical protein
MTIKEAEVQVEDKISEALKQLTELNVLPDGYRCRARIYGQSRKKRQSASFETSWSPDTDSIEITFEPKPQLSQVASQPVAGAGVATPSNSGPKSGGVAGLLSEFGSLSEEPPNSTPKSGSATDPLSDLIKALDRAESQPGYTFVALKWFRDAALPAEGFAWLSADAVRNLLREAIEKKIILTSKVPNPRSPQFPVTAIRLNRLMPEVKATLGSRDERPSDFQPVPIRGENLSATVLRERR